MATQKPTGARSSRARSKPPEAGQAGAADGAVPPNTQGAEDLPGAQAERDEAPMKAAGTEPAATPAGGQVSVPPATRPRSAFLVTGPARGRWRIGRHFAAEPVALLSDDLTEAELDRLLDDPDLTVIATAVPH